MQKPLSGSNDPNHVAIIMDGNNRWAKKRLLPSSAGYKAGADRLYDVLLACREYGIKALTVFAFSSENWKRSPREVSAIMSLFASQLKRYQKDLIEQRVRLKVIGRRDNLSAKLTALIEETEYKTREGCYHLTIAVDYGGRWDIVEATKTLAEKVKSGEIDSGQIDEQMFNQCCQLNHLPPVDLLIRTGNEQRISNFLLWQISYSEIFFANCLWPDFDQDWVGRAIADYRGRQRRFGSSTLQPDDMIEVVPDALGDLNQSVS